MVSIQLTAGSLSGRASGLWRNCSSLAPCSCHVHQLLVKIQAIFESSSRCNDSAALRLASLADGLALSWLHRVLVTMVSIRVQSRQWQWSAIEWMVLLCVRCLCTAATVTVKLLVKIQAIFESSSRCNDSRPASLADGLALSWQLPMQRLRCAPSCITRGRFGIVLALPGPAWARTFLEKFWLGSVLSVFLSCFRFFCRIMLKVPVMLLASGRVHEKLRRLVLCVVDRQKLNSTKWFEVKWSRAWFRLRYRRTCFVLSIPVGK